MKEDWKVFALLLGTAEREGEEWSFGQMKLFGAVRDRETDEQRRSVLVCRSARVESARLLDAVSFG